MTLHSKQHELDTLLNISSNLHASREVLMSGEEMIILQRLLKKAAINRMMKNHTDGSYFYHGKTRFYFEGTSLLAQYWSGGYQQMSGSYMPVGVECSYRVALNELDGSWWLLNQTDNYSQDAVESILGTLEQSLVSTVRPHPYLVGETLTEVENNIRDIF